MTTFIHAAALVLAGGAGVYLLYTLLTGPRPFKTACSSALLGVAALFVVLLAGQAAGETLHLNPYTLGTSALLGLPGVVAMLVIKILWQI